MCLPTSATGTSGGPGDVLDAQTVIKMWPDCSPMSQEQIETLISKIWWRMPEIFDQNHDWIGDLLRKEPKQSHFFTFNAAPSIGLLLHWSKGGLVHWSPTKQTNDFRTTNALGFAISPAFIRTAFSPSARNQTVQMIENIKDGFKSRLDELDWIGDVTTRDLMKRKIDNGIHLFGYPDYIMNNTELDKTFSDLTVSEKEYFENQVILIMTGTHWSWLVHIDHDWYTLIITRSW